MGRPSAECRPSLDKPTTQELGYIEKCDTARRDYVVVRSFRNANPPTLVGTQIRL